MRRALSPAVALAWLALGPGPAVAAEPPALTVFAAADLTFAFRELAPRFEKATGVRVTLGFGSTGNFAHQIREGGPGRARLRRNHAARAPVPPDGGGGRGRRRPVRRERRGSRLGGDRRGPPRAGHPGGRGGATERAGRARAGVHPVRQRARGAPD